ncbi:MAG TPA: hypothetical protein PKE45_10710, partial [Caldilineaceae bacterium]|nr:hypothetical protein [Caldilineaceae bacterium]
MTPIDTGPATGPVTGPAEMEKSRAWVGHFLASAADLPITFTLDGQTVRGIPATWQPVSSRRIIDANIIETVFTGSDPKSGLQIRVECTEYRDYPVVEWVAWLINTGQTNTPLISDLLALDGAFAGATPALIHCNGDFYSAE